MVRTGKALEHLPLLSQAYEEGEISSTHVREITRVATPETENFWYEATKKSTTRQIEKLVAFSPKGGLPPTQLHCILSKLLLYRRLKGAVGLLCLLFGYRANGALIRIECLEYKIARIFLIP